MPMLDIATAQSSLHNHLSTLKFQTLFHAKFTFGNEKGLASSWNSIHILEKSRKNNLRGGLKIKAIATLEPTRMPAQSNEERKIHRNLREKIDSSNTIDNIREEWTDLDEREQVRRMKISNANKGNRPWNKGKKHSPETRQRIKEKTRLAMQDPKVKMKLVDKGHAQSDETRVKIGVGVRMGWERRRERLMLQETCHFEWQNLIAETSRKGLLGEQELQWDSYEILNEQLEKEWLEGVEQRKQMSWPKTGRRAPKTLEQRRKIAEAIVAKWADPEYRNRVYSGITKYHGTRVGVPRKPRKPIGDEQLRKKKKNKKKDTPDNYALDVIKSKRLKRKKGPLYKDPLFKSKLEMIKSIRKERAAIESKQAEAIAQAKLLIAEAEKAAKSLEAAATRFPFAKSSLLEARKLISEAVRTIESIETEQTDSQENNTNTFPPPTPNGIILNNGEEGKSEEGIKKLNGTHVLESAIHDVEFSLEYILNGKAVFGNTIERESFGEELNGRERSEVIPMPNGVKSQLGGKETTGDKQKAITKRWVRGRLVEVAEEGVAGPTYAYLD